MSNSEPSSSSWVVPPAPESSSSDFQHGVKSEEIEIPDCLSHRLVEKESCYDSREAIIGENSSIIEEKDDSCSSSCLSSSSRRLSVEKKYVALILKLRYARAQTRFSEALRLAERAVRLCPDYFMAYLQQAYVYMNQGNSDRTRERMNFILLTKRYSLSSGSRAGGIGDACRRATSSDSERRFWKCIIRGDLCGLRGDYVAAQKHYTEAVECNPNHWYGYFMLGYTLNDLGRLEESNLQYRKALRFAAHRLEKSVTYNNIGVNYKLARDNRSALRNYTISLRHCRDFVMALKNRANLLRINFRRFGKAIEDYDHIIQLTTDPATACEALIHRSYCWTALRRNEASKVDLRRAIVLMPTYSYVAFSHALCLLEEDESDESIENAILILDGAIRATEDSETLVRLYDLHGKLCARVNRFSDFENDKILRRLLEKDKR